MMTNEQKEMILTKYIKWEEEVSDMFEDKYMLTSRDIVFKILEIVQELEDVS